MRPLEFREELVGRFRDGARSDGVLRRRDRCPRRGRGGRDGRAREARSRFCQARTRRSRSRAPPRSREGPLLAIRCRALAARDQFCPPSESSPPESGFDPSRGPPSPGRRQCRLRRVLPRDSEILERLRQKGSRVLRSRTWSASFRVGDGRGGGLPRAARPARADRGEIARVRGEKYSAIEFSNLTAGRLSVRPEGYGFVLVDGGPDLFVPRSGMHGAMDGDTVLAREERTRAAGTPRGPETDLRDVVKVLDRARERVVGRFESRGGAQGRAPVRPEDRRRRPHRGREERTARATERSSRSA